MRLNCALVQPELDDHSYGTRAQFSMNYKTLNNRRLQGRILNVVNNPLTYLASAVLDTTLHLNLRRTDIGGQRGIDGLADEGTLGGQTEVLKQHGGRENLCHGLARF